MTETAFKVHTTCDTLPMSKFIKCLCNKDYRQLIIEGEVSDELLKEFFEIIKVSYVSMFESKDSNYVLSLMMDIANNEFKHEEIRQYVKLLENCIGISIITNEAIAPPVKELRLYGYRQPLNVNNKEEFKASLVSIMSNAKLLLSKAKKSSAELKIFQDKAETKEVESKDFAAQQVALSRFMGYRVDYDVCTVTEYCLMFNEHNKYIEVQNALQNNMLTPK